MPQNATAAQKREISALANDVFGGRRDLQRAWMRASIPALGYVSPGQMKKSREGADHVIRLLNAIKYGVYL